ncbi:putative mitochondrial protein [Andalucia godoyi]|uniref:Putative mitochondrial protein n=1 Tax=Andalucia godoyi TaxID=505711 RepID=A0A8K0AJ33_ANDGO|nr:putative mitochondrial protein [Andalucia godoyi]|eukprot:ANDGO_02487.mRNA.1 putative mitochondrial protein
MRFPAFSILRELLRHKSLGNYRVHLSDIWMTLVDWLRCRSLVRLKHLPVCKNPSTALRGTTNACSIYTIEDELREFRTGVLLRFLSSGDHILLYNIQHGFVLFTVMRLNGWDRRSDVCYRFRAFPFSHQTELLSFYALHVYVYEPADNPELLIAVGLTEFGECHVTVIYRDEESMLPLQSCHFHIQTLHKLDTVSQWCFLRKNHLFLCSGDAVWTFDIVPIQKEIDGRSFWSTADEIDNASPNPGPGAFIAERLSSRLSMYWNPSNSETLFIRKNSVFDVERAVHSVLDRLTTEKPELFAGAQVEDYFMSVVSSSDDDDVLSYVRQGYASTREDSFVEETVGHAAQVISVIGLRLTIQVVVGVVCVAPAGEGAVQFPRIFGPFLSRGSVTECQEFSQKLSQLILVQSGYGSKSDHNALNVPVLTNDAIFGHESLSCFVHPSSWFLVEGFGAK